MAKPLPITTLGPDEVFVFGCNTTGFHGAGAAGYAFMGVPGNVWRTNPAFQRAKAALDRRTAKCPYDPADLVGRWAVLGSIHFQRGREGASYGVITTEKPGKQGAVDDDYMQLEIYLLMQAALTLRTYRFLCADFGLDRGHGGFSWWEPNRLRHFWRAALEMSQLAETPANLKPPSWVHT